ncbi:glycosyltransferase [Pelagibacteraceae bacterium]|nr:glycosyltransferase [Pelagibacteraceae bacterium]
MKKYIIIIPVYNDWQSVLKLIDNIDLQINNQNVDIVIINDASTEAIDGTKRTYSKINSVKILNLINNTGHCQGIATALQYCNTNLEFDYIIPMDGDGEDRPEELKKFFELTEYLAPEVITANRIKRSEGTLFKALYVAHKFLTYVMIGKMVKFGNYSCLSKKAVGKILSTGSIWLTYSGSIIKNFSSIESISSIRGARYFGSSKMNFAKLAIHSLNISASFRETIFIRSTLLVMFFSYAAHETTNSYFLIPAMLSWVFMLFMFYLSRKDDLKKLNASYLNIKDLTTFYNR